MYDIMDGIGCFFMGIIMLFVYFLPTCIAVGMHSINTLAIFLTNLLLGWTMVGWVVALIWATVK